MDPLDTEPELQIENVVGNVTKEIEDPEGFRGWSSDEPEATVQAERKSQKSKPNTQKSSAQYTYSPGNKPFECALCGKSYSLKGALKKHHDAVHEAKKPFECATCGKAFAQKITMQKHCTTQNHVAGPSPKKGKHSKWQNF